MIYAFVVNNELHFTKIQKAIPKSAEIIKAFEDNVDLTDIIFDGQEIRIKTKEEKLQEYKSRKVEELNSKVQQYIDNTFRELDWGNNEADALASIRNTIDVKLGEILYLLEEDLKAQGKDTSAVTVSSFWKKAALYFAGKYSSDQAIQELQALGVTDETIQKVIPLLEEAISAAALKLWDEQVWDYEEKLEEQIQKATSIEEIDQLMDSIQFPPPPGGEG